MESDTPVPDNEKERIRFLKSIHLLDTPPDAEFDRLTKLGSRLLQTPMAQISILDENREWFKASVGSPVQQRKREHSICTHAILDPGEPMIIENLELDHRIDTAKFDELENEPRSYLGKPIVVNGYALGTFSVRDTKTREFTQEDIENVSMLAEQVEDLIRHRKAQQELTQKSREFQQLFEGTSHAMIKVNGQGIIEDTNPRVKDIFGYEPDELTGQPVEELVPENRRSPHQSERQEYMNNPTNRPMGAGRDLYGLKKDGTRIPVEIGLNPIETESGTKIIADITGISERKQAENELKKALKDKETLLKELHHRVKNNLAVISSLVALQKRQVDDPEVEHHLADCENRIRSMSQVHEMLYRSDNLTDIALSKHVEKLVRSLIRSYSNQITNLECSYDIDDNLKLEVDRLIPCSLLVNEAVSNALEHGFSSEQSDPHLSISFQKIHNNRVQFSVSDNGTGLPEDFNPDAVESLGLELIQRLSESQLNGNYSITSEHGTTVTVTFPLDSTDSE